MDREKFEAVKVRVKKAKSSGKVSAVIHNAWNKAQDNVNELKVTIATLEEKLGITSGWTPGDAQWEAARKLTAEYDYVRALDHLERLVVARLFELSRQHQAGLGTYLIFFRMRSLIWGTRLSTSSADQQGTFY